MIREQILAVSAFSTPDSPPGMTTSKSSKTSSFHSLNSNDGSLVADVGHFEDIGLEDDGSSLKSPAYVSAKPLTSPEPVPASTFSRNLSVGRRAPKPRRSYPNLHNNLSAANPRSTNLAVITDPRTLGLTRGSSPTSPSAPRFRNRSTSPVVSLNPRDPSFSARPRRGSWQSSRERKTLEELENECDEDDGDDIPDDIVLDNVPISPRPSHQRSPSRSPTLSLSPDRAPKERVRSVGNGTPPVAQDQGSLRSPPWKSDTPDPSPMGTLRSRTRSWNAALAELSAEAKALTEKLEEHADEMDEQYAKQASFPARPNTWNASQTTPAHLYEKKERVKSTPELPPLRRTNIMVDPLPISKEKEAVLSRTRPSWLPPKDPNEEKRHLREYQRMMAASIKADERREAARRSKTESRDSNAGNVMHIWENDIVPRWNEAIRERRTRDMWWKGIAPRSRGVVWARAIGNELGLSRSTFETALARAHDVESRVKADKGDAQDVKMAKWFEQIRKDAGESTWKELRIFEVGGPLHQSLVDVLSAYAMYRNDIGYVSGCNTIAALLLLNLPDVETSFIALANILNRALPLSFLTSDRGAQASAYNIVLQMLRHKSGPLYEHLTKTLEDVEPEQYLGSLFTTIFTSHLAIDEAARLWDVYVFEGDALLVRAAIAVLLSREMALLGSKTAGEIKVAMSRSESSKSSGRAVGEVGAEDRFIQSVRDAGKS
ncbi:hypothetical protein HIM_00807 [Hirsutella minnesotensis 3608]|nr:hypothetical protein HIM_00807 [Hirsutella minnesotensis 3608]